MRKKHGSVPKIHTCSGPDSHNEQTPAFKVPLQAELRFHLRRYEQPPMLEGLRSNRTPTRLQVARRPRSGSSDNGLRSRWPNSSSDALRADAAATRPSPTSLLEGRGQAIKAKEPEARSADGGGDPVGDEDFFSRHHLNADDGSHLPTGISPLRSSQTGEHRPPRKGAVPGQRQDRRAEEAKPLRAVRATAQRLPALLHFRPNQRVKERTAMQAACNRTKGAQPFDFDASSMEAQAHTSCNRRAGYYVRETAPPLAPVLRLLDCGTGTATRGDPARDPTVPAEHIGHRSVSRGRRRDGRYDQKWTGSNGGGRRAEAAVKSSASSRPLLGQRENPLPWREDDAPVFCSSNGSRTHNSCPANHSSRRINSAAGQAAPLVGEAGNASPPP
jgi:hypothetical protein